MIRNNHLRERIVPPKNDVTASLTFEDESLFCKSGHALAARNLGQ